MTASQTPRGMTREHLDAVRAGVFELQDQADTEMLHTHSYSVGSASYAKHLSRAASWQGQADRLSEVAAHLEQQIGEK